LIALAAGNQDGRKSVRRRLLHIGRHISTNRDESAGTTLAHHGGAVGHRHALREPEEDDGCFITGALEGGSDDAIDVAEVVRDRLIAILAGHPARDNLSVAARVETVQPLYRDQRPAFAAGNELEL